MNDTARLTNELQALVGTICPDVDEMKLSVRLEEILTNYDTLRKSNQQLQEDLQENISLYISSKKLEGLSSRTLSGNLLDLQLFAAHCKKATAHITTPDIRAYLAKAQTERGLMNSTVGKKLSTLKSFFGWLVQEEIILKNPVLKINPPKTPKRLAKGLSIEELELVRECCHTLRERALLEVFYSTGCRLSEIANMRIDHINFQDMSASVIGKGDKERIVFLTFKACYHLKKYLNTRNDDCPYLFVTERRPFRQMKNCSIQREINKIEQRADIGKKLHPHVLRHTYATLMRDAGIELGDLQHLMGHSSPATTLRYLGSSENRSREAHRKYHVQ